jgi:dTDP-4-amino-4,6-dideoxygalactose transaminase
LIPLLRPKLPPLEKLEPYLRQIDESRWYSNFGPLERQLESRLSERFNAPAVLFPSGTAALTAALLAFDLPCRTCLVPSWTFVASAAAVVAAQMTPRFGDVNPETWKLLAKEGVDAVMVVSPFGAPVALGTWRAWEKFTKQRVLVDAAAGFDSVASVEDINSVPVMISLHATKVLGAGEGGVILCKDEAFIAKLRQVQNFGGTGAIPGINGKLSEYHAAVGLAALDAWNDRRAALAERTERYRAGLAAKGIGMVPGFGDGWVSSYCTILRDGPYPRPTIADLAARGIEARQWWGGGVHTHPAFKGYPHEDLPVTEDLARRHLSLPFSPDITLKEIDEVLAAL